MSIVIAAVIGGALLLWGGTYAVLRSVQTLGQRHFVLMAGYATLVTAAVTGLVLFSNYERQKQHRAELQAQMEEFSRRLSQLSDRLVAQLEEKADLTASEFEVRAQLQHERESHGRTQAALDLKQTEYTQLKQTLDQQLAQLRQGQADADQQMRQRAEAEDQRYRLLLQQVETQGRTLQGAQQSVAGVQDGLARLASQTSSLQSALAGSQQQLESRTQGVEQKVDALVRTQASLQDGVSAVRARVDSLYKWGKD